jgi:hypothetical protein
MTKLIDLITILKSEDDLGVIVRSHIQIEAQLNQLIEKLLPFPDSLPHLRFEQKIRLHYP